MANPSPVCGLLVALLPAGTAFGDHWAQFDDQTELRLVADPEIGAADPEEKHYAWADVDRDGDIDLVVARKQPATTPGGRRNVLFLNEDAVLVDRTADFIPGFLDATNDRDVELVDLNNDDWPDLVTSAACHFCTPGIVSESRLYLNLGDNGTGTWLGYGPPTVLLSGDGNRMVVAAGDVTGDGYADLYFVSAMDSLEDQLLINGGAADPGVFASGNDRLTPEMRESSYGTGAVITDMDGDGDNDIVKSETGPVEMFRNTGVNGPGQFDFIDTTFLFAAYHVTAGHLNGDGMMDLVIVDDGFDRYILNDGDMFDGQEEPVFMFPDSQAGWESRALIADLDKDGWNDVVVPNVSVDYAGCNRAATIFLNNADPPDVTFTLDTANLPAEDLLGVFDIAAFDLDGDGDVDLVFGSCEGTQIWMQVPPAIITFMFPDGLPQILVPEEPTVIGVELGVGGGEIVPGSPALHVAVNGGEFTTTALTPLGGGLYEAVLPAVGCSDRVDFYFSAEHSLGPVFTDPPGAPEVAYGAIAGAGIEIVFADSIEGDVSAWTVVSDPSLTSGEWEQAEPNATIFNGSPAAPGEDATPEGTMAFVTENGPPGGNAASDDVDGGPTYLTSPPIDLAAADGLVTYARWAFSEVGVIDPLNIEVSNDDGASWVPVESVSDSGGTWQTASFQVGTFVPPTSQVRVRFGIADLLSDSVTEAGIDDFVVTRFSCGTACPWDLDGDGEVGIEDFLLLLAGWGDPYGIADFLDLLGSWGPC